MKKILRFLLMPIFVITPTVTVIACGSSGSQISPVDILNSAVGEMKDHTFLMAKELGLSALPSDTQKYDDLSQTARGKIESYYQKLVEPGLGWDYPAVKVKITHSQDNLVFLTKYKSNVEARIVISAHLTYQKEAADKDIVIKITNDKTSNQQKIDAIGTYLKEVYLKTNPVFAFDTLFPDNLASNAPGIEQKLGKITDALTLELFSSTNKDDTGVPVIDVAGVKLTFQLAAPSSEDIIYTLNDSAIDATNGTINGTLQNLVLTIGYYDNGISSEYHLNLSDLDSSALKVAQNLSSVNTQIANTLNVGSGLQITLNDLPTAGKNIQDYDVNQPDDQKITLKVQNSFFALIAKFYPTAKMDSTNWIATKLIKIDNADSTPYVVNDETHGYFIVTLSFNYEINGVKIINVLVSNVKLNINKTPSIL